MKTYIVAMHISTALMSLHDLASVLGVAPHTSSFDRDTPRSSTPWKRTDVPSRTTLKIESEAAESAGIDEHIRSVLDRAPLSLIRSGVLPQDAAVDMDIAVMFDTPMCSLCVEADTVRTLGECGISLALSAYPSDFD